MAGEGNGDDAVIIALGGNLPGEWPSIAAVLEAALAGLDAVGLKLVVRSSLWRSAAWPDPCQPEYLNAVAFVDTGLAPRDVLGALQGLEQSFGRVRSAANAARVLDLDLIAYGRLVIEDEAGGLILPHPRAASRGFVMGPLAEIAPDWRHPVSGKRAADLAKQVAIGADAAPRSSPLFEEWGSTPEGGGGARRRRASGVRAAFSALPRGASSGPLGHLPIEDGED